jgi:hypothetical protein
MTTELLCPECMGTLELLEGGTARCTIHGGEYKVLFHRGPQPPPAGNVPPVLAAAPGMCVNHTNLRAAFTCNRCGKAICQICAFPQDDDTWLCPLCATMSSNSLETPAHGGVSAVTLAVQDRKCHLHPNVAAVQICKSCGVAMCATCDFALPGNLHLCPRCATTQRTGLSPKRKVYLVASFVLAAWCTAVMAALLAGAFQNMAESKESETAFGMLLMVILLIPAIIGTALGVSSMDRRLPNSIAMWIATIWNGIILGGFLLLMIVGMFMK